MKRFIVLAIIAIVLVSGCTSQSFFSGYETETKAEEPDIISFTSPTILPQIIFDGENKTFHNYKTKIKVISLGAKILSRLGLEKRLFR